MTEAILASRAWVFDVDGCLVRTSRAGGVGGTAMPRAADLLTALRAAGRQVLLCTNASELPPEAYAANLRAAGIPIQDADLVTAGSAAADAIAQRHPGSRVLVVGDEGVATPLRQRGLQIVTPGDALADVVVVSRSESYSTALINAAALAVDAGAPLYTTMADPWFHGGVGKSVAITSAIAAAIAWTTGTAPVVLGKPSPALAEALVDRFGLPARSITVVGDSTAEVELARQMGANAVLVLTGSTSPDAVDRLPAKQIPDRVLPDIAALFDLLALVPANGGTP